MSIVNGAQTTGAIGSHNKTPDGSMSVPARFIKTGSETIIHNIIQYNNSQNKVTASDFRSNDKTQKKLRDEIAKIPKCEYQGGRRGGNADIIRRQPNMIPSYTAGQALAAFAGDPGVAYHQKTEIWASDKLYSKYFNDHTTGTHIVFAFSLLRAVESRKVELVEKSRKNESSLTKFEIKQLEFFRRRGSIMLFTAAVASCLESILSKRIPNPTRLSFGDKVSSENGTKLWSELITPLMPLTPHLESAFDHGLKNQASVATALSLFGTLVESTKESNKSIYVKFKKKVK